MDRDIIYLERENAALRLAWLFKRQQELIANGMKIEQSRIHAETELNSWIARMMSVPPNAELTSAPSGASGAAPSLDENEVTDR